MNDLINNVNRCTINTIEKRKNLQHPLKQNDNNDNGGLLQGRFFLLALNPSSTFQAPLQEVFKHSQIQRIDLAVIAILLCFYEIDTIHTQTQTSPQ